MASSKYSLPDLLEVTRSDGTLVMDCNSGLALLSLPGQREEALNAPSDTDASGAPNTSLSRRPKSKLNRN